ncbi:hypothetical protein SE17_04055 [Kouleothrix aurantiaca]|uniref:Uncharacterized protein n=1 Tax=Kouleothrix aurantiaca TaxID=186479 RepID=A0A0P9DWF4_9CHLR|nr:hypothetical protein SE17_04055 [Kouleothrix aurantiaca]
MSVPVPMTPPQLTLPQWWDQVATEQEQRVLLARIGVTIDAAGVPWAFLPRAVQTSLITRFGVKENASPQR